MCKKIGRVAAVGLLLLVAYGGAYYLLSRRGCEFESQSDKFFYIPPRDTTAWRIANTACVWLFVPVNAVDRALFLGRPANRETRFGV